MSGWRADPRLVWSAQVAMVVAGMVLVFWALPRIEIVHSQAAEGAWLRRHATTRMYTVVELGLSRRDGTVESVIVAVPGHLDAFVDLRHSSQQVRVVGETVRARVRNADPDAVGFGVASDAVDHRFVLEYVWAGSPILLATTLCGLTIAVGRATRPPRPSR